MPKYMLRSAMSKEAGSFKDNIRRTFIRFSIVPVAAIVTTALFLFVFSWIMFMTYFNEQENMAITQEITKTINICSEMLDDVKDSLVQNNYEAVDDEIFASLYSRTSDFDDMGNLIIISSDMKVLFSSKNFVPKYLTDSNYSNWGVWHLINKNKDVTGTILYNNSLVVTKGVYEGTTKKAAIIYIISSDTITSAVGAQNRYVLITDVNGWVYASNTKRVQDDFGQIESVFYSKTGFVSFEGSLFYCNRNDTGKGIFVYTINDISKSIQLIWILIAIIVVIFGAIVLISIKSTESSSEHYTRDITKIEDAFEEVQNGNLDVSLDINSSSEFKIIGNDFNKMLQGLKDQIEQNKELAENAAFSQVKQLESQFNPHFLFNTLDNIRFMAKIDAAAADKMIVSLSGLLRYSIREMKEEVTVREDLANLQNYFNILQIRFNKRFSYKIDVSEDIMDCLIPKLLIQPLLENAVKYGFNGQEKLNVNIRGYQMQENLIFVCEDDGAGIEEYALEQIRNNLMEDNNNFKHYGIYNVHRRIKLMYQGDYGLNIKSKVNEGTTVRLTIPKHTS